MIVSNWIGGNYTKLNDIRFHLLFNLLKYVMNKFTKCSFSLNSIVHMHEWTKSLLFFSLGTCGNSLFQTMNLVMKRLWLSKMSFWNVTSFIKLFIVYKLVNNKITTFHLIKLNWSKGWMNQIFHVLYHGACGIGRFQTINFVMMRLRLSKMSFWNLTHFIKLFIVYKE